MPESAAEVERVESYDSLEALRWGLKRVADEREDWAGIPMPLGPDLPLVIEPNFPKAKELMAIGREEKAADAEPPPVVRAHFWSSHKRCHIVICEPKAGERSVQWAIVRGVHNLEEQIQTLGASVAWGIEQESNALKLLATLLPHHAFKKYLLCGAFLESSERSGVTYMFRKLRPTVALVANKETMRILASLCMHPIAYYEGSWAGAMCPTDDVIAHLMLMRANEPLFWKRSNQHPAWRPEAGL